jgi:hypothetical protein
MLKVIKERE